MTQELDIQNYDLKSIQKIYNQVSSSNLFLNDYTLLDVEEIKKKVHMYFLQKYNHKHIDYIQSFVDATATELINKLFEKNGNKPGNTQMVGVKNVIKDERKLNPSFFQETYRIVNIDSMYRNHLWLTNEVYDSKTSTNMTITLNDMLDNVTTLELTNVCIPFTFYNIDPGYGNHYFYIQETSNPETTLTKIEISGGNYDNSTLIANINTSLTNASFTDVDFSLNTMTNKVTVENTSNTTSYDLIFYDYLDTNENENFSNEKVNALSADVQSKLNNNLGWILGFRNLDYSNNCLEYTISTNATLTTESLCFIPHTKYFIIVIDDLNKNQTNKGLVQISNERPFINKTTHYKDVINDLSLNCLKQKVTMEEYRKMTTRQITKNELYSALQINNYRSTFSEKNSKLDANLISNVFAVVPFENKSLLWGSSIFTSDKNKFKRKYSGPVNISKMNVKLLDDRGNLLNLNGAEWSFSMISTHLYQH